MGQTRLDAPMTDVSTSEPIGSERPQWVSDLSTLRDDRVRRDRRVPSVLTSAVDATLWTQTLICGPEQAMESASTMRPCN